LAIVHASQTLRLEGEAPVFRRILSRAELEPGLRAMREGTRRVIAWEEGSVHASATIRVRQDASPAIDLPLQRVSDRSA
jgi:hypothetical protein